MRIYVAGPMRGIPYFNFPAFDEAAEHLRELGHDVFNPADHDRATHGDKVNDSPTGDMLDIVGTGFDLRAALGADLDYIASKADAVAVLPGWEASKGARAEVATALALGLPVAPWRGFGVEVVGGLVWDIPAMPSQVVVSGTGEVRTTSASGGEKGVKPARFDLIPAGPLWTVAELYGYGASKYADRNWELGYEWSKSFGALMRHAQAFWMGHDLDDEPGGSGLPHMASVVFHAFALMQFADHHPSFDDRPHQTA